MFKDINIDSFHNCNELKLKEIQPYAEYIFNSVVNFLKHDLNRVVTKPVGASRQ